MGEGIKIQHSMFTDIIPDDRKIDIVVEYEIVQVNNYRVSGSDHGRNIAAVQCRNAWPVEGHSRPAYCKGKASIYHYQWMDSDLVVRCPMCGHIWLYSRQRYEDAHNRLYTRGNSVIEGFALVDNLERAQ